METTTGSSPRDAHGKGLHAHFPDFRDSEVTFRQIMDFLAGRYDDQSSEYQSLNMLLDTFQKPGESFSDFLDKLGGLAARSGFPNAEAREFFIRHQALRGTSLQTIRVNAIQHQWSMSELRSKARGVETSVAAGRLGGTRGGTTLQVDLSG